MAEGDKDHGNLLPDGVMMAKHRFGLERMAKNE